MKIEAELILMSPATLDPETFLPEKTAVVKLRVVGLAEEVMDAEALGDESEATLEREIGKEVLRVLKESMATGSKT